jgi:hypothetical protein
MLQLVLRSPALPGTDFAEGLVGAWRAAATMARSRRVAQPPFGERRAKSVKR